MFNLTYNDGNPTYIYEVEGAAYNLKNPFKINFLSFRGRSLFVFSNKICMSRLPDVSPIMPRNVSDYNSYIWFVSIDMNRLYLIKDATLDNNQENIGLNQRGNRVIIEICQYF